MYKIIYSNDAFDDISYVFDNNIFYIIDENNKEVLIFRVLHHRRNIDNLLK